MYVLSCMVVLQERVFLYLYVWHTHVCIVCIPFVCMCSDWSEVRASKWILMLLERALLSFSHNVCTNPLQGSLRFHLTCMYCISWMYSLYYIYFLYCTYCMHCMYCMYCITYIVSITTISRACTFLITACNVCLVCIMCIVCIVCLVCILCIVCLVCIICCASNVICMIIIACIAYHIVFTSHFTSDLCWSLSATARRHH